MVSEEEQYLERLPFWEHLDESERELTRQNAFLRRYKKGEMIFSSGGDCLGMTMVVSGGTRTYLLSEEGREITLFRMEKDEVCVLSASCVISQITFDTCMEAERSTALLVVASGAFGELTERNIYVRCFMYELITKRFSSVMLTMQEILFKGYDRRLAAFLIREYDRTGSAEIHMTHEEMARQTSSAREVVARMLKRFSGDGLVKLRRGGLTLVDIEALRELA